MGEFNAMKTPIDYDDLEWEPCPACGGEMMPTGIGAYTAYYRCRDCGIQAGFELETELARE